MCREQGGGGGGGGCIGNKRGRGEQGGRGGQGGTQFHMFCINNVVPKRTCMSKTNTLLCPMAQEACIRMALTTKS